jgi:hypothetical protein
MHTNLCSDCCQDCGRRYCCQDCGGNNFQVEIEQASLQEKRHRLIEEIDQMKEKQNSLKYYDKLYLSALHQDGKILEEIVDINDEILYLDEILKKLKYQLYLDNLQIDPAWLEL